MHRKNATQSDEPVGEVSRYRLKSPFMLALSIRQPFAELILRGIKTVELRTRPTRIIGERFHIYATKRKWSVDSDQWPVKTADNIVVPNQQLPEWMIEL